mmetsp:Transcript_50838/g.88665  ORF Transcript_50838/g.88665 Transcript_50838/m.88665 type:complete len:183 (-) Transcript_50838:171-719(-)
MVARCLILLLLFTSATAVPRKLSDGVRMAEFIALFFGSSSTRAGERGHSVVQVAMNHNAQHQTVGNSSNAQKLDPLIVTWLTELLADSDFKNHTGQIIKHFMERKPAIESLEEFRSLEPKDFKWDESVTEEQRGKLEALIKQHLQQPDWRRPDGSDYWDVDSEDEEEDDDEPVATGGASRLK